MGRVINKSIFLLGLSLGLCSCQTTSLPEPIPAPTPAAVYVPEPAPAPKPEPEPVSAAPDQRWLPGHSSYTTPVPVEPVLVDELGPVVPE